MTGIHGFAAQDQAVQESMGPICDRTRERLGTSDTAIIAARRLLLAEIKALAEGREPFRRGAWRRVLGALGFAALEAGRGVR